jgi:hypothetical protein
MSVMILFGLYKRTQAPLLCKEARNWKGEKERNSCTQLNPSIEFIYQISEQLEIET